MNSVVSKLPAAARIFLGLVFTVFGLNGFFGFIPQPEPSAAGGAFLGALAATGYMFPLIKGTEVIAGLLLLSNRFVPLALTILAPVTVNILAYHLVLDFGPGLPLALIAAQVYLATVHREAFRGLLTARSEPTASSGHSSSRSAEVSTQGV